ncbi:hypothetical protein MKEN_01300600 [Mycena kentingensis (nom. inval.)]|nr:hypothetical protein MKEN_01300600 [Mycena kentingensis (nom. inval.)]
MAPTATQSAQALLAAVKENAELKSALESKGKDLAAAEHAVVLLVQENADLLSVRVFFSCAASSIDSFSLEQIEKQTNLANDAQEQNAMCIRHLNIKVEDAEDEIERLRAQLKERNARIRKLEDESERREKPYDRKGKSTEDYHRKRRSAERDDRHSRDDRDRPPRLSRVSEALPSADLHPFTSSSDRRKRARERSRSSSRSRSYSRSRSRSRSLSRGRDHRPTKPNSSVRIIRKPELAASSAMKTAWGVNSTEWNTRSPDWSANSRPVTQRTLCNSYMNSLPAPGGLGVYIRPPGFDESKALGAAASSWQIFENFPSNRQPLHLPGRTLWANGTQLHAIAYAPTHELASPAGDWIEHRHLADLAASAAEVELFVNHRERVFYAGTYRVLSFRAMKETDAFQGRGRGVEWYTPGATMPNVEVSPTAIYRAMRLPSPYTHPQNVARMRAMWPDAHGKPKTDVFGLQYVGYDRALQAVLRARLNQAPVKLKEEDGAQESFGGLGVKRKFSGGGSSSSEERTKPMFQNNVWTRRAESAG